MPVALRWTQQLSPVVYVTPNGIQVGTSTYLNDGGQFGPDTLEGATALGTFGPPYSQTYGIQEAISLIGGGGTVIVLGGEYHLTAPLYNTGNNQTVIFEPGVTIYFGAKSGSYSGYINWNGDFADIWAGCNYVPTGTPPTNGQSTYHDCYWLGNDATINCNGQSLGNNGEEVFGIFAYITDPAMTYPYDVLPSFNIGVEGFNLQGFGGAAIILTNNAFQQFVTAGYRWTNIRISKVRGTMAANASSTPYASGVILSGCCQVSVDDCYVDCSNVTWSGSGGPDVSNCFITSERGGDTENIVLRRSYFKSGGGSPASNPGSVFEIQGCNPPAPNTQFRGNTHDIIFEDCIFDSGATSGPPPVGGAGGGFMDDTDGATTPAVIYAVEFRRCQWVNCGVSFKWAAAFNPGIISFDGQIPQALAIAYYPPTWYGPEESGRSILHRSLSHSLAYLDPTSLGYLPQILRIPLTTVSTGLVNYYPRLAGHYRITLYLICKIADTPTVTVDWVDPDVPSPPLSYVLFSGPMIPSSFQSVVFNLVAAAAPTFPAIQVLGKTTTGNTNIYASVIIEQIQ